MQLYPGHQTSSCRTRRWASAMPVQGDIRICDRFDGIGLSIDRKAIQDTVRVEVFRMRPDGLALRAGRSREHDRRFPLDDAKFAQSGRRQAKRPITVKSKTRNQGQSDRSRERH